MNVKSCFPFLILFLSGVNLYSQYLADTVNKHLPGTWGQSYIKNGIAQPSEGWGHYYFLRFRNDHTGIGSEEDQCSGMKTKNNFSWSYDEKDQVLNFSFTNGSKRYFIAQLDSVTLHLYRADLPDQAEDPHGVAYRKLRIP